MLQQSEKPPAQPSYILRGHSAQIHAVHFFRGNTRLLTGDANGWVVLWSTSTKRAVVVWKPHTNTILGVGSWDEDKILTHGRDNKIRVWQLREEAEKFYSRVLPIDSDDDQASTEHKQPWLLHTLPVNALNFCSFSMIRTPSKEERGDTRHDFPTRSLLLLGTPGFQDGSINLTSLPDETRVATIPKPERIENAGMIMAIGLVFLSSPSNPPSGDGSERKGELQVLAGYESGHACIWTQLPSSATSTSPTANGKWQCIYTAKTHAQPILSLDIAPELGVFFTSGADAIIARHSVALSSTFLTSSTSTTTKTRITSDPKILQSRHAGQQGLKVRNDEKIFATAGWDGKMRVYSIKGLKELAVLKWHKEGCYAIAFAEVIVIDPSNNDNSNKNRAAENVGSGQQKEDDVAKLKKGEVQQRHMTVAEKREELAKTKHWLAAGSKDGKVSLWDIY